MMLTLDQNLAELITALKWANWHGMYHIAVQCNPEDATSVTQTAYSTEE